MSAVYEIEIARESARYSSDSTARSDRHVTFYKYNRLLQFISIFYMHRAIPDQTSCVIDYQSSVLNFHNNQLGVRLERSATDEIKSGFLGITNNSSFNPPFKGTTSRATIGDEKASQKKTGQRVEAFNA